MYLQVLGSQHRVRQIPKELYPKWTEAMIATLRDFHGLRWHEGLEKQWTDAIGYATRVMFEGYEHHYHV